MLLFGECNRHTKEVMLSSAHANVPQLLWILMELS